MNSGLEQVGYLKWVNPITGNELDYFSEWFMCGSCTDHMLIYHHLPTVGTISSGATYSFRANRHESGDGKVDLLVCVTGTSNCDVVDTGNDPYNNGWGNNTQGVNFGETHDLNTDMPGTTNARVNFTAIQAKIDSNWQTHDWTQCAYGGSVSPCGQNPSRYWFSWFNNPPRDHFRIWTDPL